MTNNLENNPPPGEKMASRGKFSFSTLKTAAKKALSPSTKEDYSVANALAAYHVDQTRILNRLGRFAKDEPSVEDPQEWQHSRNDHLGTNVDTPTTASNDVATQLVCQETPTQTVSSSRATVASSNVAGVAHTRVTSLSLVTKPPRQVIALHNVAKPIFRAALPKSVSRIKLTPQLAFAHHLLPKKSPSTALMPGRVTVTEGDVQEMEFDEAEEAWMAAIKKDPVEQGRVRWLGAQVVAEFLKSTQKDLDSINEVVLLGPVLDRKDYRSVLNSLIVQLEHDQLFALHLLQGLSQLLQEVSPGYLIDDDLVRILRVLRQRLKDTFQSLGDGEHAASDHIYHLTGVVARVLDTMVEGNVQGLNRNEDHKPLLDILDDVLKGSDDPYFKFQVTYAWQAFQYVGDDESPLHAVLRFGGGVAKGAVGVASVLKFDLDNVFKGLQELGAAAEQAYDVVKSVIEGVEALREGGEGAMDSMLKGFRSGPKRAWYPALQSARVLIHQGRLADFQRLIFEAPCRRVTEFQRGVCQLLGEIAIDPIWPAETRQQTVALLGEMYGGDGPWSSDLGVKEGILGILQHISVGAEQSIQDHASSLLRDLTVGETDHLPRPFPLLARLPLPAASPLLAKVIKLPSIEYHLHRMMDQRIQNYERTVFIPPLAKANLQAKDEEPSSLLDKVLEFLKSDQQVFLVLGDSGGGKSTFNRHLEHFLIENYQPGTRIPLFINLPDIKDPEKNLVEKRLKALNFSDDDILDLKQDRQFTIICDGYDESQLLKNLHSTNSFNRSGQWNTKLIIGCRSTYLSKDYVEQFQPQPLNRYSPATPHLFQETAIVPFSSDQIRVYVEQFVRETGVHELFDGEQVWTADEYMAKLETIPNLKELVKNPFMLQLALRTLPAVTKGARDPTDFEVTRLSLYQTFVNHWIHLGKLRLMSMKLERSELRVLNTLKEAGFSQAVVKFLENFATAIFRKQDGNPVVEFTQRDDGKSWKAEFLGSDTEAKLKREASPLTRAGDKYRFIHRSLLEYFYTFEEHEIHQFRTQRVVEFEEFRRAFYFPLQVKTGPQSSGDETYLLMDEIQSFLGGDRLVFLLLGDEGSGKTTFCRRLECELWDRYTAGGRIPLRINLAAIYQPDRDLIGKHLRTNNFSEAQIQELKQHRQFLVICDGYDESQLAVNLHTANRFNQPGQWSVKMVISCKTHSLGQDYRSCFIPDGNGHYTCQATDLFQEAVIAPFFKEQIENFVELYVQDPQTALLFRNQTVWSAKEYMDKLTTIPNVKDLVKNPLLLTLTLKVLPRLVASHKDLSSIHVTRVGLYDMFVDQWLEANRLRLQSSILSKEELMAFNALVDDDFIGCGINYLLRLSAAIFQEQDGNPVVQYIHRHDNDSWKAAFFGSDPEVRLLRDASPLMRTDNQYCFVHRSMLEYFLSRTIYNSVNVVEQDFGCPIETTYTASLTCHTNGPLYQRNLLEEPSIIQFLCDRVSQDPTFGQQLRAVIEQSKTDAAAATAAANAITILVRAGVHFNSADLRGIRIAGADLSDGQFDSAQLQGADLRGVNFARSCLRQADFGDAQMDGVRFEELPYLEE